MAVFSGKPKETWMEHLRKLPSLFIQSIFRHGYPNNDVDRSEVIFKNFFLHFHPVKCHKHSLNPFFTLGLGVICFSLFIILICTGVVLMFWYIPLEDRAHAILRSWQTHGSFIVFFRNMHRWSAHMMVLFVFLHMTRVFYTGSYKGTRRFNWVIGMLLLVCTFLFSFTGYLLPWDQISYWGVSLASDMLGKISHVSGVEFNINWAMKLASQSLQGDSLLRFYVLHVAVLPMIMTILIGVHFWRVRKDGGLSRPPDRIKPEPYRVVQRSDTKESFAPGSKRTYGLMELVHGSSPMVDRGPYQYVFTWPHLLRAEMILFGCTFLLVSALSFIDAPLGEVANPSNPPNPIKLPWYLLGLQETCSYPVFLGGIALPIFIVLALTAIPYLDRNPEGDGYWFHRSRYLAIFFYTAFITWQGGKFLVAAFFRGANWSWIWP